MEFNENPDLYRDSHAAVDPVQAGKIAQWRKTERERLIALRLAISVSERIDVAEAVALELDQLIEHGPDTIISLYWPFRGELDLRGWMKRAHERGSRVALPVVVGKAQPLIFREWMPGCPMDRGVWNIPIPAEGPEITPNVVLSPLVGYDPRLYRLGYGGGFFDRTLAAIGQPVKIIGVGHPCAAIPTIHPQSHDIPMDVIVTGAGQVVMR